MPGASPFFDVNERLTRAPISRPPLLGQADTLPAVRDRLARLIRDAARAFLEMLVLERHRIWLLHTVTGPAAVEILLSDVELEDAERLVAYVEQAVVAMFVAYGEPFEPGAHVRPSPASWNELVRQAVDTRSVHTIKLVEALVRLDPGTDTLYRSVAEQWLEWR